MRIAKEKKLNESIFLVLYIIHYLEENWLPATAPYIRFMLKLNFQLGLSNKYAYSMHMQFTLNTVNIFNWFFKSNQIYIFPEIVQSQQ